MSAKDIHPKSKYPQLNHGVLAGILDLASDAIICVDQRQSIVLFNKSAKKLFGYPAKEVRGHALSLLFSDKQEPIHLESPEQSGKSGAARKPGQGRKILARRRDGSVFPAEASTSKIELDGQAFFSLMIQDTTLRGDTEDRLRAALREKEVLLEEIHHRVKNNLQVITSLLRLQARSIKDGATRKKFEESRHRIQAMAILHEILYESPSLAEIDFADYIRRLAEHLMRSYGAGGRIRLQIRLEPLHCHRDVALPCGLIVNELLSNAFKYAFPGGKSGEVRIELRRENHGKVRVSIGDNGVGLPPSLDWKTSPTLGLRLVRALARQFDATVATNNDNGTVFSIMFLDGLPAGVERDEDSLGRPYSNC